MPLFRSQSSTSAEAAPHRSDLDRQIGCIAGFFQIFDQHSRKQIAGPPPTAPQHTEGHLFADPVLKKEDDSNLANLCSDSKVPGRNEQSLLDTSTDACHACSATQVALASDGCLTHPSQEHKLPKERSFNVRKELSQGGAMVRHGPFNHKQDYREDDISFSPQRAHIGAYAAGGRRFTSIERDLQARFCNDTHEGSRGMPKEEEKWGFWSSPASHWPTSGEQERPREKAWAEADTLDDWKPSVGALVRLREDGHTGALSGRGSCAATQAAPRVVRNDPSASPGRASAFDFKDAIRWSQRVSFQAEGSRRSLDDRDLPRSIAELRDAINARSRLLSAASLPPSPRTPSVVARLMGLEDLPKPPTADPSPSLNHRNRKPSGEAKLLQQLLQYSPPTPSSLINLPLPPSPTTSSTRRPGQGLCSASSADSSTFTSSYRSLPISSEVPSVSRDPESMAHMCSISASNAKLVNSSLSHAKTHESTRSAGSTWEGATEHRLPRAAALKKNNQQRLPVVVLKQGEDMRSPSPRSSHGYHDEIERRLRQLGLQSSEQERKTLKQILEGMQVKGLLQSGEDTKFSNEAKRQQVSFTGNVSPVLTPSNGIEAWPPPTSKSATQHSNSSATRPAKHDSGASIVIMRPVAKSVSKVAITGDDWKSGNERAATSSSRTDKSTLPRKPKISISSESNSVKDSAVHRPKLRSTASKVHSPVPSRKVSLRLRQSQVHVLKGPNQALPSEQARRSGSDDSLRRLGRVQSCGKPVVINACSNTAQDPSFVEANYGRSSNVIDKIPDVAKQPNRKLAGSSGASSDVEVLEVTSIREGGGRTPPRESKGEHNFGVSGGDCCAKEQCSPVSVLDPQLSEDEESSSSAPESVRVLADFQESISRCSSSVGDLLFSLQEIEDIEATQSIPVTINCKEFSARDEDFVEATEDISQAAHQDIQGQACNNSADLFYEEDVLNDDDGSCACVTSYFAKDTVERSDGCGDRSSGACDRPKEVHANDGNCLHMDATRQSIEDFAHMDDSACARDIMHMNVARTSIGEDVCGSQGIYAYEEFLNNAEFCYTEDVLRAAGLTGTQARGACAADGWLACGGKICRQVFEELEEQWDAKCPQEEGGNLKSEDRDRGGELYWKSQQASMRRRLIFDCLNEIVEGHLSWLEMPGTCSTMTCGHLPVSVLWGDLQRLEQGSRSAEDSMYAMLEQDLLHDADYSTPFCWRGTPTQLAAMALHLESNILDALVSEILPQAPP